MKAKFMNERNRHHNESYCKTAILFDTKSTKIIRVRRNIVGGFSDVRK